MTDEKNETFIGEKLYRWITHEPCSVQIAMQCGVCMCVRMDIHSFIFTNVQCMLDCGR